MGLPRPMSIASLAVLNEFLVQVPNVNVITFLILASFPCFGLFIFGLCAKDCACVPCTRKFGNLHCNLLQNRQRQLRLCMACASPMFQFLLVLDVLVSFVPPNVVGYYEFDKWLYVLENLELPTDFGHI